MRLRGTGPSWGSTGPGGGIAHDEFIAARAIERPAGQRLICGLQSICFVTSFVLLSIYLALFRQLAELAQEPKPPGVCRNIVQRHSRICEVNG